MSEIVVADKYRANRIDGKYDVKNANLIRKGMKVLKGFIEDVNDQTSQNGVFFKVDKDATESFLTNQAENQEVKKAKAELSKVSATDLIDVISKAGKKEAEKEDLSLIPIEEMTMPQLKKFAKDNDISIDGNKKEVVIAQILEAQNK